MSIPISKLKEVKSELIAHFRKKYPSQFIRVEYSLGEKEDNYKGQEIRITADMEPDTLMGEIRSVVSNIFSNKARPGSLMIKLRGHQKPANVDLTLVTNEND